MKYKYMYILPESMPTLNWINMPPKFFSLYFSDTN